MVEPSNFKNLDFGHVFDTELGAMPPSAENVIAHSDFRYRQLSQAERDTTILGILNRLESGELVSASQAVWERAWAKTLQRFAASDGDIFALVPQFIRPNQAVRLNQEFVKPYDSEFELNFSLVIRHWIFDRYIKQAQVVYDFGCGSGFNLALMATTFPDKIYYGLDWADSSQKILAQLASRYGWQMSGRNFDFYRPDTAIRLEPNSAVLTWGALEQVGDDHMPFVQFLLDRRPAICINVEPIAEWYDPDNLVDALALKYHHHRGYLRNYLSSLRDLEQRGRVQIIATRRLYFGSLYHEAYSYVIWRPVGRGTATISL